MNKTIRPLHKSSILGTEIMDEKQIKSILANPNDEQKQAIEFAKSFFQNNQQLVEEQTKDVIALYSIKNKKPFFFITPAEARIAIDFVKQERTVNIKAQKQRENERKEQEQYLFTPIKLIKENEILHSNENSYTINDYNFNIVHRNYVVSTEQLSITALNQLFAVAESKDQIVVALIINSQLFSVIRGVWGQTVYDPSTQKDVILYNLWGYIYGEPTSSSIITSKMNSGLLVKMLMKKNQQIFICIKVSFNNI